MNIDFSKKPEGATHWAEDQRCYSTGGIQYYCQIGVEWYFWGESLAPGWNKISGPGKPVSSLEATIAKEWPGGLPPPGTVCEVKGCISHYLQWNKVTVFAVRGKTVMFDMEDGRWGQTDSHEFRKIRTPEQIAAEERESAIDDMVLLVTSDNAWRNCATLYDAGYRKQEILPDSIKGAKT